jgi:hypothetical protein
VGNGLWLTEHEKRNNLEQKSEHENCVKMVPKSLRNKQKHRTYICSDLPVGLMEEPKLVGK